MHVFEGSVAPADPGAFSAQFGAQYQGAVVTIGNFDGLHRGHQSLLKTAAGHAGPKIVLTFDPHPSQVLFPERAHRRLLPRQDLIEQLPRWHVDFLWILPFTRAFASLAPSDFLEAYVGLPFAPHHIVAGYDFAFGKDREGSLAVLETWAAARRVTTHVVPPLKIESRVVSSRRLREMVGEGDVESVARLLGRPFYLRGEVISGAGRGKQFGFPTLNQAVINETLPPYGVYASFVRVNSERFASITNVGVNPTFDGDHLKVETHVLDRVFEANGQTIDVELLRFLRPEMKFGGIEDLLKQIQADILKARMVHLENLDGDRHG